MMITTSNISLAENKWISEVFSLLFDIILSISFSLSCLFKNLACIAVTWVFGDILRTVEIIFL